MEDALESYVPYRVTLRDSAISHFSQTIIHQCFCGYLVNNANGNFYFELHNNRMLVIVPHSDIIYMAPDKKIFDYETQNKF